MCCCSILADCSAKMHILQMLLALQTTGGNAQSPTQSCACRSLPPETSPAGVYRTYKHADGSLRKLGGKSCMGAGALSSGTESSESTEGHRRAAQLG